MNRRSDEAAEAILEPLTESQRSRLVAAMTEVHRPFGSRGSASRDWIPRAARPCGASPSVGFESKRRQANLPCLRLEREQHTPPEPEASRSASDPHPLERPDAWGDRLDRPAGEGLSIGARDEEGAPGRAQLGIVGGDAPLRIEALLETARQLALVEAIRLYESAGYVEVAPFNADPYADHWFEKRLS